MEMLNEDITRKMDELGRVVIPKAIRMRYNLEPGDEMNYYTIKIDDKYYIALANDNMRDKRFSQAAEVLAELGIDVPEALLDRINEEA